MATLLRGADITKNPDNEGFSVAVPTRPGKFKIDFASNTKRMPGRSPASTGPCKFPEDHNSLLTAKGQLFIVADTLTGEAGPENPARMTVEALSDNYFSYPTDDISFGLQRAFDIANRKLYQYAQAHSLSQEIGVSATALALVGRHAYFAHVGNCRVYRVSVKRIEQLTHDHSRVVELLEAPSGKLDHGPYITRMLGRQLGTRIDTSSKIQLHRDEFYVICSNGYRCINEMEMKSIVLSSSPQKTCDKLTELALQRGATGELHVQVIKIYNYADSVPGQAESVVGTELKPEPSTFSHVADITTKWSNWPIYLVLLLIVAALVTLGKDGLKLDSFGLPTGFTEVSVPKSDIIRQQLNAAHEYIAAGQLELATQNYQSILQNIEPKNGEAQAGLRVIARLHWERGDNYAVSNDWFSAQRSYALALGLWEDNDELANRYAEAKRKSHEASLVPRVKQPVNLPATVVSDVDEPVTTITEPVVIVDGIERQRWFAPGLQDNDDFRLKENGITFYNNIRVKKFFYEESYDSIEVEVQAYAPSVNLEAKFGLIFGHVAEAANPNSSFYLFSVNRNGEYLLEKVGSHTVRKLCAGRFQHPMIKEAEALDLKVKYAGRWIFLYINGVSVNMQRADTEVRGGVGLYSDAKLLVEFSEFKITPSDVKHE